MEGAGDGAGKLPVLGAVASDSPLPTETKEGRETRVVKPYKPS